MSKTYIGVDNGIGTIGVIADNYTDFIQTPIKNEQSYTKKKQNISRIIYSELHYFFVSIVDFNRTKISYPDILVILERPMVNSGRFKATATALRCLEATLICLEVLSLPYIYTDSKSWQKELLPSGLKGSPQLKKASVDVGCRLFPQHKNLIIKHKDADGILIAEWARRKNL